MTRASNQSPQQESDDRRGEQDINQKIVKLQEKALDGAFAGGWREAVGTETLQTGCGLPGDQPPGAALQTCQDLPGFQGVPERCRGGPNPP